MRLSPIAKKISEDTDLRDMVVKFSDEDSASQAVSRLKKYNIPARYTDGMKFGTSSDEREAWGVLVRPSDVEKAGRVLDNAKIKGAEFDPYTHID